MSQLHVHFLLRSQQAFQRLLDGSNPRGQSSASTGNSIGSGGKSWNKRSPLKMAAEVNARDQSGRTVLHLACSATDASAPEYVRMLLAHPAINVNLADEENHWTALHRSLYHGNLAAAILLLQRSDTDTSLKDLEGYTAFDLYNSTIEGTLMTSYDVGRGKKVATRTDLFTWGANRNAALGLGNGDDRVYPEMVNIRRQDEAQEAGRVKSQAKFSPVYVCQIAMSKLHTAVVTDERRGNVRVCGFGSGGRLGPGQYTQYSLTPIPQLTHTIVSVALGQDHTLALTSTGEVLSWGLNRFSQLGYVIERDGVRAAAAPEEPIQATPRKVVGLLKKQLVVGVAACKTGSACWTYEEVFTWGTNGGQLGYDRAVQPVQVLPRKVSKFTSPVISIVLSDSAMVCLLETQEVMCIWNDRTFKINFPAQSFPSDIHYRPRQSQQPMKQVACCDYAFAALSEDGKLFTFTLLPPSETDTSEKGSVVKPQRVWSLRNQFSDIEDMTLGLDGSIIICTKSGHVFVRSRNMKSAQGVGGAKAFKFQRVPYLQRVIKVAANSTGAFAALRLDYVPEEVKVVGNQLAQDLAQIQPYMRFDPERVAIATGSSQSVDGVSAVYEDESGDDEAVPSSPPEDRLPKWVIEGATVDSTTVAPSPPADLMHADIDIEEDSDDVEILADIRQVIRLCTLLALDRHLRKEEDGQGIFDGVCVRHGADIVIRVQGITLPAHRVVLAARSSVLENALSRQKAILGSNLKISMPSSTVLSFQGVQPMSVLILLVYLYSDRILAIWDPRIQTAVRGQHSDLRIAPLQVKAELQTLASLLELHLLSEALKAPAKRTPTPSICRDIGKLYHEAQTSGTGARAPCSPDVILQLGDKDVFCHSAVLRARCPFFAAFFDDDVWTAKRWSADGTISVDLKNLSWPVMEFVLRFLCCGDDEDLFDNLDHVDSVDELLDFVFDVMAAASELLLDRLMLICASVILQQVNIYNACYVLTDASHLRADPLVESVQGYIAVNMETLLECQMLDNLQPSLIKQLSAFIRTQQAKKWPSTRSNRLVDELLEKHKDWLSEQDIPTPIVPSQRQGISKDSAKLSPPGPLRREKRPSPRSSPVLRPNAVPLSTSRPAGPSGEDIFVMDDAEGVPPLEPGQMESTPPLTEPPTPTLRTAGPWKATSTAPRSDLKSIMAEAEESRVGESSARPIPTQTQSVGSISGTLAGPSIKWVSKSARRNQQAASAETPERVATPSTPARGTPGSPWKVLAPHSVAPIEPPPAGQPSSNASVAMSAPGPSRSQGSTKLNVAAPPSPARPPQPSVPRPSESQPVLGPVYSPLRQPPPKDTPSPIRRNLSSGTAWTAPPVQAPAQPSPSGLGLSFAAIQMMQMEQDNASGTPKRSLREIQEEERERQQEAEFLRWWAAEEERVRLESQGQSAPPTEGNNRPKRNKKPKGQKKASEEELRGTAEGVDGQAQKPPGRRRKPKPNEQQDNTADEGTNIEAHQNRANAPPRGRQSNKSSRKPEG